jgi:SAM-dependent methyltransferase
MTLPFLHLLELALVESDLRTVREVIRRSLSPTGRTLELGCGPGHFADLFATGDYVGVDPRERFVDYARRHRPGAFICDELFAVGLPDARFEQALGLDVLGPASEAAGRRIAAEIKRLLLPGGRVLLLEQAKSNGQVERLAATVGRIERRDLVKSGLRERLALLLST